MKVRIVRLGFALGACASFAIAGTVNSACGGSSSGGGSGGGSSGSGGSNGGGGSSCEIAEGSYTTTTTAGANNSAECVPGSTNTSSYDGGALVIESADSGVTCTSNCSGGTFTETCSGMETYSGYSVAVSLSLTYMATSSGNYTGSETLTETVNGTATTCSYDVTATKD